jgi:cell filamentation protein
LHFDNAFRYIDQLISEFRKIPKDNNKLLAWKLSEILDTVNYLHPFREGNGRAQREFLRLMALEKGLVLILNPPDNKMVYELYMKGTVESDVNTLAELILKLIDPNS